MLKNGMEISQRLFVLQIERFKNESIFKLVWTPQPASRPGFKRMAEEYAPDFGNVDVGGGHIDGLKVCR